jgi:glucoamylase
MLSLRILILGCYALWPVHAVPGPSREGLFKTMKRSASSFLATETPIALADMLCNIGSAGSCVAGANSGIVVASPDQTNPDCMKQFDCILAFILLINS